MPTRRAVARVTGLAAAAVVALALVPARPAPRAAEPGPLTVAALLDLTGAASALGEAERIGLALAEREIASRGGVAGRPLRLVVFDTATNAQTAARGARIALEGERAIMLLGGSTGAPAAALTEAGERAEVPVLLLAEGRAAEPRAARRWIFQVPPGTSLLADALARDLARRRLRRVGLLEAEGAIGAAGRAALEAAARRHGLEIAAREPVSEKADLAAAVVAVVAARPQALVVWAIPPLAGALAQPILDLAPGLPHYQSHAALTTAFLPLAGAAAAGVRTAVPRMPVAEALAAGDPERPRLVEFIGRVRAAGASPSSPFVGYGYDALGLAVAAIERAAAGWTSGEPSLARRRFDVREAIEATRDYRGVTGVYGYGPGDHQGLDGRALVIVEATPGPEGKAAEWRPVREGP